MKMPRPPQESTILIVDDELFMREVLQEVLKDAGFITEEARNCTQALSVFQKIQPDLVLLNVVMPEMDGFAVCEALRKLPGGMHVPVLMMTNLEETKNIHRAFEEGAIDFISKPINNELIIYRIRRMLRAAQNLASLQKSESRLADAQRIAKLGHWEWDTAKNMLFLSDEIFRIFGLTPLGANVTYKSFLSMVHPDDRDRVATEFHRAMKEKTVYDLEHRIMNADGKLRHVHNRGEVSSATKEMFARMFGTIQDITERKLAEEQLTVLKEAVECLPIGITITNTDGKIIFTNPAEAEIHGYTREELLHKEAHTLASPKLRSALPINSFENLSFWKRESINIRKNGTEFPVHLTSIPVKNAEGRYMGFVTACEDITERKAAENKIEQLAYYDPLTNLPNRRMFQDRLGQSLARSEREGLQTAVLFLDLDRFKEVNDAFGHEFGDKLLQAVAKRLEKWMRKADTVARLGGDEFVILLSDIEDHKNVAYTAGRILESFASPFDLEGRQIYSSTSIGIAFYPTDGENVDELLKNADAAMYHAKSKGRQTYCFFSEKLNLKIRERISLETDLRHALENGELVLHYQPQIGLNSDSMIGVEALVRWQCPKRGLLDPDHFVGVAEETGLIYRMGEWVLRTACAQLKEWQETGRLVAKVAVNISGYQFKRPDFMELIDNILRETGLEPGSLELELTESVIMDKTPKTISRLNKLKAKGIYLSIDDFGTGYSSLSYLKHFPIDRIKIDRIFVRGVLTNRDDAGIVDAIIAMAHSLNLKVLAEGVETKEQLNYLKMRNCDEAQGYYFSKPLKAEVFYRMNGTRRNVQTAS